MPNTDTSGHMSPELQAKVHEVQQLMRQQHHPHTQLQIDSTTAVMWEGVHCVHNPDFKPVPQVDFEVDGGYISDKLLNAGDGA